MTPTARLDVHAVVRRAAVGLAAVAFAGSYLHVPTFAAAKGQHLVLALVIAAMPEVSVAGCTRCLRSGCTLWQGVWAGVVLASSVAFTVRANLGVTIPSGAPSVADHVGDDELEHGADAGRGAGRAEEAGGQAAQAPLVVGDVLEGPVELRLDAGEGQGYLVQLRPHLVELVDGCGPLAGHDGSGSGHHAPPPVRLAAVTTPKPIRPRPKRPTAPLAAIVFRTSPMPSGPPPPSAAGCATNPSPPALEPELEPSAVEPRPAPPEV